MTPKQRQPLFEKQAQIANALAHPLRIAIVNSLKDGPQCVCDIAQSVASERSNVSRHLLVMVNAGLLEYRKEGLKVIYNLRCPCILEFFSCITAVLKQQAKDAERLLTAL